MWHERFGYANYKVIRQLANGSAVDGMHITNRSNAEKETNRFCEVCIFGKHCRKTFNSSDTRADKPGTLIYFVVRCQLNQLVELDLWRFSLTIIRA